MPSREEHRQLELDDRAASSLARPRGSANRTAIVLVGVVSIGFVGWMFWSATRPQQQRSMLTPDDDTFKPMTYQAPVIDTPPAPHDTGKLVIQPPPPPPPPPAAPPAPPPADAGGTFPPMAAPAAVAAPPPLVDNSAEEERKRKEEEERQRWLRLKSPMVVTDAGGKGDSAAIGSDTAGTGQSQVAYQETDANRNFLNQTAASGVEISRATKNDRTDALVAQGTMIRGILETAIQSDLPGMVRAITTEDVWSFDGRRILIPAGTRLIGEYKSGLATGQTRVFIVWTRVLRADGVSVQLGSYGTDNLGRSGLTGQIDNHYAQRFGAAIMLSVIGGGAQYLGNLGSNAGNSQQTQTTSTDPITGITTTTTSSPNQNSIYAQQIAAQQVSQTMNQIASEALRNSINIAPTINVDQGASIMVFVRRDLDFSSLYPDPVTEMMKELRNGRVHPASTR